MSTPHPRCTCRAFREIQKEFCSELARLDPLPALRSANDQCYRAKLRSFMPNGRSSSTLGSNRQSQIEPEIFIISILLAFNLLMLLTGFVPREVFWVTGGPIGVAAAIMFYRSIFNVIYELFRYVVLVTPFGPY